jgi:hypothetical protein
MSLITHLRFAIAFLIALAHDAAVCVALAWRAIRGDWRRK